MKEFVITADIILEIVSGEKYECTDGNRQKGKEVRALMEDLGWTYTGEILKKVYGQQTTVAEYKRGF